MSNDEYIPIRDVMAILGISQHKAAQYAKRVRTRKDGRRTLYHRGDIEATAKGTTGEEQPPEVQQLAAPPQPPTPSTALIQGSELVGLIERQGDQIATLAREAGQLQGAVEVQRSRAEYAEVERERLRVELEHARQPKINKIVATVARSLGPWLRLRGAIRGVAQ